MKRITTILTFLMLLCMGVWADVLPSATVGAYFIQATPTMTAGGGNYTISTDASGNVTISPNNSGAFGENSNNYLQCTLVIKINVPSTTTAGILCQMRKASGDDSAAQGLYMNSDRKLTTSWGTGGRTSNAGETQLDAGEHTIIYIAKGGSSTGAEVYVDGTKKLTDSGLKASGVSYKAIYIPAAYASYITEVHYFSSVQSAANITSISTECSNHIYASQHAEEESVTVGSGKGLIIDVDANLSKFSGASDASSIGVAYGKTLTVNDAAFNTTYLSKVYGTGNVDVYGTQSANFATCETNIVYYGGAGTSESRVSIAHNGGAVKLTGAEKTYYLGGSNSATQTTVNFDGTTVDYSGELGIGAATYNINNTSITTPRFITSQGGNNRAAVVNLTGNTKITVTGNSNVDSNQSSIMIGHWNGSSNVTLSNTAQIEALDAQLLIGKTNNNQTITLNGSSNITAKGIKVSGNAGGTNTLNLNGGSLNLGDVGITSYSSSRSISINVTENSTITATAETLPLTQPITVASGKTLTIDGDNNTVDLASAPAPTLGTGSTINFIDATVTLNVNDRNLSGYTFTNCTATAQFVETGTEYAAGGFTITNVPAGVTVKVKKYGTTEYETVTPEDGTATISHSVGVSGSAAWLDYTFNETTLATNKPETPIGNIPNRGNAGSGQTLTIDNSQTSAVSYNEDGTFKVRYTPYRNMTWPENYTVAVSGNFPDVENGCLVAFGTRGGNYLALIRGANSNEIKLVKGQGQNAYTNIQTMAAENATAAAHLVVFTKQGNVFKVYCDGVNVATTEYDQTLGGGLQVGSIHGGYASTGVVSVMDNSLSDDQKNAVFCNAIRVYDYIISAAQMETLKSEFPYVSQGGNYTRTISADANLDAENAWYNVGEETNTNLPTNNVVEEVTYYPDIVITTAASSTLTVNADMDSRNIEFNGAGKLTIASDGTHNISIKGSVTVNGPISVKYGGTDLSAVPVSIGESGSIEFDFSAYDFSGVITSTDYPVTGNTSNYGDKVTSIYPSDNNTNHTYTLAFNSTTNSYYLTVAPTVAFMQDRAVSAILPYYTHLGSGVGNYTVYLGSTPYTNGTELGTAIEGWTTLSDCVEPIITINQPATGKFYRIKGYSNNYITSNTASNNAAMNGTASANNIVYYSAEQNFIFYGSGLGMYNTSIVAPVANTLNAYTFSEGAQKSHYYIQSNAESMGTYCYDNTANGTKVDRNNEPVTSGKYQTDWTLEEVTSLPVTISSVGYATLYAPVALTIPSSDGVKAYTGEISGDVFRLSEVDGTIPANTGVVLIGDAGTYNFNITSSAAFDGSNDLLGTVRTIAKPGDVLVLGMNDVVGFYTFTGANLSGFKTYLPEPTSGARALKIIFDDSETTGVNEVIGKMSEVTDGAIYDLQGRKVANPSRGMYIINGHKVVVK